MNNELVHKNQTYSEKKDPWSSHSIIFRWLVSLPEGARILDVGTASGTLGKRCAGLGFTIDGIEPVCSWADEAKPFYSQIICTQIENAPDEYLGNHDVVVCADILEHLPNPESQLSRLVNLQEKGTQFIISVPNVANIWVRIQLLFGNFNYSDRGILDRTHLRFFTRKTFIAMLNSTGLEIIEFKYSPIPLNLVNRFFDQNSLGRIIFGLMNSFTQILPTFLAYQFVARTGITDKEVRS